MAVWVKLNDDYSWGQVAETALKQRLVIGDYGRYDTANTGHNSIRIGFATYDEMEMRELVKRLKFAFREVVV